MPLSNRSRATVTAVLFACLFACGCGKRGDTSVAETGHGGSTPKVFQVGMSQCNLGEPWRVQMNADLKAAADKVPDLAVTFKDAQNDTLKQRAQVEEFVAQHVDLLIISPKEAQPLTQPVAEAMDAGIPVIVLDRKLLGDRYTAFIGADNRLIGRRAGQWIVKHLNGKGNVVELEGLMTTIAAQDRHQGFADAIAGTGFDVVFRADMKWLEPDARSEAESALARYPDIDLFFAHNDPGAHGAYLAARAAGREKTMAFVGIDGLPQEGQAYVRQGVLSATFQYPTGGPEAIDAAERILHGQTVPKQLTLGSRIYTADNVARGGEPLQ